jgi:hypothetical protein
MTTFGLILPLLMGQGILPISDWPLETLQLRNGTVLRGLILEELPGAIRFQSIKRIPGHPTVVFRWLFPKDSISKIEKLSPEQREITKQKLTELDTGDQLERERAEKIDLKRIDWKDSKNGAWQYQCEAFELTFVGSQSIARQTIVRLESLFEAYRRILPLRENMSKPVSILIVDTIECYQKILQDEGKTFINMAYFDPTKHKIVACFAELKKVGEDLERFRTSCTEYLEDCAKQEAELRRLYSKNKTDLARHLAPILEQRKQIQEATRKNQKLFDQASKRQYQMLFHEAFHAHAQLVYPSIMGSESSPGELPRWLNEGLAQVFETAVLEAGEIRFDAVDQERLQRLRDLMKDGGLMPMKDLLAAGPKVFQVSHNTDRSQSDQAYLLAWGMARFLLFEKKKLNGVEFEMFVKETNRGRDPLEAFPDWMSSPIPNTERDLHDYFKRLQPDGSLLPIKK